VIGGEGALVLGGLAAGAVAIPLAGAPPSVVIPGMMLASMLAGGLWIGAAGALKVLRGVNETISSLLLAYIGIALFNHLVEGPLRDPASLNKPSTPDIGAANMLGNLPGPGCALGPRLWRGHVPGLPSAHGAQRVRALPRAWSAAIPCGAPERAGRARLVILTCCIGRAAAGLAGMVEVAAIPRQRECLSCSPATATAGILVAFLAGSQRARHPARSAACSGASAPAAACCSAP
jgi:simple sugar transport system permease protein